MICTADTVGVFQIESRAQMSMLPRLKPRSFYDLVVEVAIVRPGPIQGGMVHPYLKNRRRADERDRLPERGARGRRSSARMGVPIFQEQVMQIAMLAADFTPGEADALRRAMAAWKRKGGLGAVPRAAGRPHGREGLRRTSTPSASSSRSRASANTAFPRATPPASRCWSTSAAGSSATTPTPSSAALLNSQPMGFYAPAQLVRDAREHGVEVRPVDVTISDWESTLEGAGAARAGAAPAVERARPGRAAAPVRLGLNRINGLAEDGGQRIVAARAEAPFASAEDLARRARLDAHGAGRARRRRCAAARSTGHRHQAAWAVAGIDTRPTEMLRATRTDEDGGRARARRARARTRWPTTARSASP